MAVIHKHGGRSSANIFTSTDDEIKRIIGRLRATRKTVDLYMEHFQKPGVKLKEREHFLVEAARYAAETLEWLDTNEAFQAILDEGVVLSAQYGESITRLTDEVRSFVEIERNLLALAGLPDVNIDHARLFDASFSDRHLAVTEFRSTCSMIWG